MKCPNPNCQTENDISAKYCCECSTLLLCQVFISHDSRDKKLAEVFRKLLIQASSNRFPVFCSSNPGDIPYGAQWFQQIVKEIANSRKVICLLTEKSFKKPWILYEAGIASGMRDNRENKGIKNDRDVICILIGIKENKIIRSPFSQFQHCICNDNDSDTIKTFIKLIKQIFKEICPNFEYCEEIDEQLLGLVKSFVESVSDILRLRNNLNVNYKNTPHEML